MSQKPLIYFNAVNRFKDFLFGIHYF